MYKDDLTAKYGLHLVGGILGAFLGVVIAIGMTRLALLVWPFLEGDDYVQGFFPFTAILGLVYGAILGGASTYAIGKVFVQHFESGGTILTFDPQRVREYYEQQFEKGKKEVKENFVGIRP